MNIKQIWFTKFLIIISATYCIAQSNGPADVRMWGKSLQGVQLAITTTNDVVDAGSSVILKATTTNASTNVVHFVVIIGEPDLDLLLTDAAGKLYKLTPQPPDFERSSVELEPAKINVSTIQAAIGSNLLPGDYTLKGSRYFFVNRSDHFKLESNSIRVHVK